MADTKEIKDPKDIKGDKEDYDPRRKRELIKTILIIFLAALLLLTFFSNTIMNKSLSQITTERTTSGKLTASSPVKYFFIGAIPEFIRRSDLSLFGTREKLGSLKCPLLSKNERYFSRKSFNEVHFILFTSNTGALNGIFPNFPRFQAIN